MKIKTITCHDVYNVGASLQAYALITYLNGLGHEAEIIDYKPHYLSNHFILWGGVNPRYDKPFLREAYCLAKLPARLNRRLSKRKRVFDEFTQNYLPRTETCYHSIDELRQNPPEADVYIAGSDQIWNTMFKNGRDPAFYLDFAPLNAVRASYAASFATESIDRDWQAQIKSWLLKFDCLSVRESSGVKLIQDLGISGAVQVLDPVFLLNRSHWEDLEQKVENTEPYVLLYDFDNNPAMMAFSRKIADMNGWKLYSYLKNQGCDRNFDQTGPREFLWLIHHAQLVISNSFHATAFSILYQKPFYVFNRNEKLNSRMRDLLVLFGLETRMKTPGTKYSQLPAVYNVGEALQREQNKAKEYLHKVMSEV